jgi:hypothetical protein
MEVTEKGIFSIFQTGLNRIKYLNRYLALPNKERKQTSLPGLVAVSKQISSKTFGTKLKSHF